MTWSVRWRIGAASATLPVALWCCQVIGGFEAYEVVTPPLAAGGGGAGGTAGSGGTGGVSELCALASPPAIAPDAPSGGDQEVVVAVRALRLGEDLTEGGLDLDGRCTCQQDLAVCKCAPEDCPCAKQSPTCSRPPGLSAAADWVACDEPNGVDASSKRLFNRVSALDPNLQSANISHSIESGSWSVLLRVQDYNGQLNDDQVIVSVHAAGSKALDECQPEGPRWDGNDRWPIDRNSVVDGVGCSGQPVLPRFVDQFAFVTDGKVVAKLNLATIYLVVLGVPIPVRLEDVRIALPLEQGGDGVWFVTNGLISARWATVDVFEALAAVDNLPIASLCTPTAFSFVQDVVCAYSDMRMGEPDETQPCDAISFFADVDGVQAQLGTTIDIPPVTPECPALATLDCITPLTK